MRCGAARHGAGVSAGLCVRKGFRTSFAVRVLRERARMREQDGAISELIEESARAYARFRLHYVEGYPPRLNSPWQFVIHCINSQYRRYFSPPLSFSLSLSIYLFLSISFSLRGELRRLGHRKTRESIPLSLALRPSLCLPRSRRRRSLQETSPGRVMYVGIPEGTKRTCT